MNTVAELIRGKRLRLGMTQKELADAVGMPKNGDRTIREWERSESIPSEVELEKILSFPENIPFPNDDNADYSMIDLFAGIGGTRLGFYQTGRVKCLFSSEIEKNAIKTYRANFGETPAGDITQVDAAAIPNHDILVGGFPCQAFSLAGLKRGFDDTRGTLFFEIARILKEKKPKAFLLENVKNLVAHDDGKTFKVIYSTLENLGYSVSYKVLRARDFGVPQNRERIYIVGFDPVQVENYKDFHMPEPQKLETCLGNILDQNVDDKYTLSDILWEGHKRRKKEHKLRGNGFGYCLFNEKSEYCSTLSARYYKDGSEILIEQKGKNPRRLTPRECARLQGFPEEFIIPVSDSQAYKEFGNSVAVPVINAIAEQIIAILDYKGK